MTLRYESGILAEREGFEPSVRLPVHLISSQAPSTTRSPLQVRFGREAGGIWQPARGVSTTDDRRRCAASFCAKSAWIWRVSRAQATPRWASSVARVGSTCSTAVVARGLRAVHQAWACASVHA